MMDKSDLMTALRKLGIVSKEAKIIEVLLELGPMKIADLSRKSGIPRSSIYRHTSSLEKRGLITWVMGLQSNLITIGNFEVLASEIESQQDALRDKGESLKSIIDFTKLASTKKFGKTTINYYEGVNGIRQLIWNTLNTRSVLKAYTNATRRETVGKAWLEKYCLEFVQRGLQDHVLCDINYARDAYTRFGGRASYFSPVSKYNEISEERVFKSSLIKITGEIYIYDDVVATYSWENGYLVGSEIISEYIASTQHSIFDVLWSMTTAEDNIKNYPNQA